MRTCALVCALVLPFSLAAQAESEASSAEPISAFTAYRVSANSLKYNDEAAAAKELRKAHKEFSRKDFQAAIRRAEKVVASAPDFAAARNDLGVFYLFAGKMDSALPTFRQAIDIEPQFVEAHSNLATVFIMQDHPREAEAEARKALQFDPEYRPAHFVLALSLIRQNVLNEETLANLKRAGSRFPYSAQLLTRVETALGKAGK